MNIDLDSDILVQINDKLSVPIKISETEKLTIRKFISEYIIPSVNIKSYEEKGMLNQIKDKLFDKNTKTTDFLSKENTFLIDSIFALDIKMGHIAGIKNYLVDVFDGKIDTCAEESVDEDIN